MDIQREAVLQKKLLIFEILKNASLVAWRSRPLAGYFQHFRDLKNQCRQDVGACMLRSLLSKFTAALAKDDIYSLRLTQTISIEPSLSLRDASHVK
jgi:hypothetical protein